MFTIIPEVRCRRGLQIARPVVFLGPFREIHSIDLRAKAPAGVSIAPSFARSEDALGPHATCVEPEDPSRQAPTPCPPGLRAARRLHMLECADPNVLADATGCGLAEAQNFGHCALQARRGPVFLAEELLGPVGMPGVRLAFLRPLARPRLGLGYNACVEGAAPCLSCPTLEGTLRAAVRLMEGGKASWG